MARRQMDVEIEKEGRDIGKKFRITEMSAYDAEDWAMRAIGGMAAAGVDLGNVAESPSAEALAGIGIQAFLRIERHEQKRLGEELMRCVQRVYNEKGDVRPVMEGDIEEVSTLFTLKLKTLELHLSGFF